MAAEHLRLLVVLRALNMDRVTEGFLRCALERGHTVHVALENRKAGPTTEGASLFDALEGEFPEFTYDTLPPRQELWLHAATRLRCAIDYVRYFEPEFKGAATLRKRARSRAPWYARIPAALGLLRIGPLRRAFDGFLRAVERRLPISAQSLEMIQAFKPDMVLVSPLVETGSPQGDHLRAAESLGISTGLVVASWDNLTTKGAIRDVPDLTIVWNEDQIREAVDMHGLQPGDVVATGAHSHDHWFAWQPSTDGEEFAAKVGLAPDKPFLLYVCSSGFIAGDDEVAFVREWVERMRASGDADLEELGVLVRPHPQNFGSWRDAQVEEPGRIVVWPRGGVAPTNRASKEDYFDSLYHAKAVVGINTTALVDSAIVRRPVFTLIHERFRDTQTGTLHFDYLARDSGAGVLNVAESWDEHFAQLGTAIRSDDGYREQIDRFLTAFVRPHGLDRPAAPLALDAIAETAVREKRPAEVGGLGRWLVGATANGLGRVHAVWDRIGPRPIAKRLARRRKKARRLKERQQRRAARQSNVRAAKPGRDARPRKPGKDGRAPRPRERSRN